MTLRRITVATLLLCALGVWGLTHSGSASVGREPIRVESSAGGTRDEAEARYRTGQSNHWRHVAVGNCSMSR